MRAPFFFAMTLFTASIADAAPETVHVHLDDPLTQIELRVSGQWETVCSSPCDRDLAAGWYRLTRSEETVSSTDDKGVIPPKTTRTSVIGREFLLDPSRARAVDIDPNRAKAPMLFVGGIGAVAGTVGLVYGLLVTAFASLDCALDDKDPRQCARRRDIDRLDGELIAGAGAAVLVGSIVLIVAAANQESVRVSPRKGSPGGESLAKAPPAPVRRPTWHGAEERTASPAVTFPIFTAHF